MLSFWIPVIHAQEIAFSTPSLKIEKLKENLFTHTSFLEIEDYGSYPCNGMIYFSDNEAIIFDTPINDSVSEELIDWIQKEHNKVIKAVVVTHFHIDCLGGLNAFQKKGIESYAGKLTIQLAKENKVEYLPETGFNEKLTMKIGKDTIINEFFGPGHTSDNVVSFIPREKALFGGCLVKEMNAKKGNLSHADVGQWSKTVQLIKQKYPDMKIVVPGHGNPGGVELLDYTIQLFEQ